MRGRRVRRCQYVAHHGDEAGRHELMCRNVHGHHEGASPVLSSQRFRSMHARSSTHCPISMMSLDRSARGTSMAGVIGPCSGGPIGERFDAHHSAILHADHGLVLEP